MPERKRSQVVTSAAMDKGRIFYSKPAAYRYVAELRAKRKPANHHPARCTVYVDEGLGAGWETFERLNFDTEG